MFNYIGSGLVSATDEKKDRKFLHDVRLVVVMIMMVEEVIVVVVVCCCCHCLHALCVGGEPKANLTLPLCFFGTGVG